MVSLLSRIVTKILVKSDTLVSEPTFYSFYSWQFKKKYIIFVGIPNKYSALLIFSVWI